MTELQEKQLALLEDTVKFFNSENRAYISGEGCLYHTPDGKGCAIGRLIEDKELCKKLDKGIGEAQWRGINNIVVFNELPEELKAYTKDFLSDLQDLHDGAYNWSPTGINEEGEEEVRKIKAKFNLN